MISRIRTLALAALLLSGTSALAQQAGTYIQIEAQPSLNRAEDRVRDYASYLQDVNGFSLGGGWYGIALGPYSENEAAALLRRLRSQGQIPRDSYLETAGEYRGRFFPIGAGAAAPEPVAEPSEPDTTDTTTAAATPEPAQPGTPAPVPAATDETPREARASEADLTRNEKLALQEALRWAGVYGGAIDAAYGPGTRNAMAEWQRQNGYEVTGILTTRQRAALFQAYNAVFDGLGFERVREARAGIEMELPLGVVSFARSEAPFLHYEPTGDLDARVLLISEPGDRATLWGLYEILQTLEIVPPNGPRERRSDGFSLTGQNDRIVSVTEARLVDGGVKGFTLIWPAGDEDRRTRVLARMRESFTAVPGILDPSARSDEGQSVDLVAGLRIRQPRLWASGFYADDSGLVLTALDAVADCGRITLDDAIEAKVVARDAALGAALLEPAERLAPLASATFRSDAPRLKSEVAVSGFSYGGVLPAPTLTYGALADLQGLSGEPTLARLDLVAQPADIGGPVLDAGGAVLGMLLPVRNGNRQLPDGVSFSARAEPLRSFVTQAGARTRTTEGETAMAPEDLSAIASDMTVLVNCWE
ncbi:trypsin-like peptidase domain-containing protein [Litorisediminicola beolgyonensis]|uniref:Trypsin-like peptidase domain-containing protein n=1 Tax=Litorisediminicola beolgyonensis TaxID=1173614 RepID=A0ABW3ZGM1_9RHOB